MSHLPQRKEKDCLNCGATVIGRYCHVCGQENVEPKETAWQLITHFFNDITHFDGKFFLSLKKLFFRPGFLSIEYMKGRRARYLNPIRMYLFTSFFFFLVFFSIFNLAESKGDFDFGGKTMNQINAMSPADFAGFTKGLNHGKPMSREEFKAFADSVREQGITFLNPKYKSREQYDSLIKAGVISPNWISRQLEYKQLEIQNKYGGNQSGFLSLFINDLIHHFPQMLFLSLPFVALLLKLLYIRRKEFYYVSHAIFTVHLYIFLFIMMLIEIGIFQLNDLWHVKILSVLGNILLFVILFYLYKAMRNFYRERRFKTIVKYIVLLFSFFILISFVFIIFGFVSFLQV